MALSQNKLEPLCNVDVLKTKRVQLVQEVIFENVMPSVETLLLYRQVDVIRSEKTECDRIGKMLDILMRLTLGKQYGAFNAFILSLAGTQPDLFETLCQRSPTDAESDSCVRESGQKIRKTIDKTLHRTDSQLDEQIDFEYEYVELATDRGLEQGVSLPHEYNRHIDDIHETSQNISAFDWLMGNAEKAYKKVSIYGRAGIGKSTTLQFFAKQWARGRWAADFTMLFLLQLRFITTQVIAISTVELLQLYGLYDFPDHGSTTFSSWLKNCTSRILILIDGLDEIPGFAERMQNTPKIHDVLQKAHPIDLCINILRGDLLPGCTVISASRPFAGLSQLPVDAKAEILGLTSSKVIEYVERRHPQHAKDIMSVLRRNPILLSVCGITFYCMMITRLLSDGVAVLDEDIKTYTRLMSFIIVQYCSRKVHDSTFSIEGQSYFSKLSQLAYSGIFQFEENKGLAKLVFDDNDLAKATISQQDLDNIKKTGILQIIKRKIGRHEAWTAEFFHLSAQELLSVAHLLSHAHVPDQTLSALFDSGQFNLALRFLFGLHFDKKNSWIKQICTVVGGTFGSAGIDSALSMLIDNRIAGASGEEKLVLFQLIYEGQWDKKAKEVVSLIAPDGKLCMVHSTMTAIDLLAVDFVCQFSKCITNITLNHVQADATFVNVLLASLCTRHWDTLQVLDLGHNRIHNAGATAIAEHLGAHSSHTLQVLNLHSNAIGTVGTTALAEGLCKVGNESNLKTLNISNNSVSYEGVTALGRMLAGNDNLQDLNVHSTGIEEQGVKALTSGLNSNTGLKKLKMNYKHVDGSGTKAVAEMFRQNTCLEALDLKWSILGGDAVKLLGAGLHRNTTLTELCLSKSAIGDDGAASIATMLYHNTGLQRLDIAFNKIGDEGAKAIADSLVCNTSLRELNVSEQGFLHESYLGDAGAIAMVGMLLRNSSLLALLTSGNDIGDAGAIEMATMLLQNTSLEILNISCNKISDLGAMAIADAFCSTEDAGVERKKTVCIPVAAENRENAAEDTPLIPGTDNDVEVRRWSWCLCSPALCCAGAGVEYNTTEGASADQTEYNTTEGAGVDPTQYDTTQGAGVPPTHSNITEGAGVEYNTTEGAAADPTHTITTEGASVDPTLSNTTQGPGADLTISNTTEGAGVDLTQYNTTHGAGIRLKQFNTSLRKLYIHGRYIGPECAKVLLNIRQHDTNLDIYV